MTESGLERDKTSGIFGGIMGLFGAGGGWSEGGGRMFEKRNLIGYQSKAQAIESKENLRKSAGTFVQNLSVDDDKMLGNVL